MVRWSYIEWPKPLKVKVVLYRPTSQSFASSTSNSVSWFSNSRTFLRILKNFLGIDHKYLQVWKCAGRMKMLVTGYESYFWSKLSSEEFSILNFLSPFKYGTGRYLSSKVSFSNVPVFSRRSNSAFLRVNNFIESKFSKFDLEPSRG